MDGKRGREREAPLMEKMDCSTEARSETGGVSALKTRELDFSPGNKSLRLSMMITQWFSLSLSLSDLSF